ncbi:MAG: amino-acid N-acetyltransferase [Oceanococcaceae bacterium]
MTTSTDFAQHLRQAAPFVHAHKGKLCVAYVPGEAAQREDFTAHLFDLALAHGLGMQLILVLGARPQIEARLLQAGIAEKLHRDLRITDAATLQCVKDATGALRNDVEAMLSTALARTPLGGRRIEVVSGNLVTARPTGILDGVDMHYTGELRRIAVASIREHLAHERVVLLPCVGTSPTGESFNLRSDDLAVAVAAAMQADKLMLFSPRHIPPGECMPDDLARAELPDIERSIALRAVSAGVSRVHLLPMDVPGVVLSELYTHTGQGLMVSNAATDRIRPATIEDIGGLLHLIAPLEANGTLVPRSREQLELDIEHFAVMEHDGMIIGCRALLPLEGGRDAELACVVVHPDWRGGRRAATLVRHAEASARNLGIERLFVLTTRTVHWFVEQGFAPCAPDLLPGLRKALYNWQRASQVLAKTLS